MTNNIGWTDETLNVVTGCTEISPGCRNCYAKRMAKRLQAMGQKKYKNGFEVTLHPGLVRSIQGKGKKIFVCSMADLFHKKVPLCFIQDVFESLSESPNTFQIVTKRSGRLLELSPFLTFSENIWIGVSVENADYLYRIDDLRGTGAHLKFLSLEPLLGPLKNMNLDGIHWVIVGGESGPFARPMHPEWIRDIRDQCIESKIPFYFKGWGEWGWFQGGHTNMKLQRTFVQDESFQAWMVRVGKKKAGCILDGQTWKEMPV